MHDIDANFTMVTMSSHTAQNQYLSKGLTEKRKKKKITGRQLLQSIHVEEMHAAYKMRI